MTARDTVRRLETEGPSWSVLLAGLRHPRRFLRELVTRVMQDRTLTVAAAMSYYFFFALFPLLLFILALVSVLPLAGSRNGWSRSAGAIFRRTRACSSSGRCAEPPAGGP